LEENLAEGPEPDDARAARTFRGLNLHHDLATSRVPKLFADGHFANAVEDACKVLRAAVQRRSGRDDLDGAPLMQTVFSPKTPTLRFSELKTESEQNEQQGMMFLFAGAMTALRNPRAHELVDDHPDDALDYIQFVNMLLKALERTH